MAKDIYNKDILSISVRFHLMGLTSLEGQKISFEVEPGEKVRQATNVVLIEIWLKAQ
ncbi:cold-shock protein [Photobacterium ganghwense]|nr:cold-shock protein [Photobacterium ganghwense]